MTQKLLAKIAEPKVIAYIDKDLNVEKTDEWGTGHLWRIIGDIAERHQLPKKTGGGQVARYCRECGFPYPCPTIDIIEKGIKSE